MAYKIKAKKYRVYAHAYSQKTGKKIGKSRSEIIDTKKNSMFYDVENKQQVKERYEGFWNMTNSDEKVKVDKIVGVK